MPTISFTTRLGADRVIRIPDGVSLPPGPVEITIMPLPTSSQPPPQAENIAQRLARAAKELNITDLPADLAENHDFYAHGAPKGVDRP